MERAEIAVIGGGLIGAAAARHLAEAGRRVALIAAPEPTDWSHGQGPFASHYDASRITRVMAGDPVWAELAARSIARYPDIAQRSAIPFHDPRGLAWLGIDLDDALANAVTRGADARMVEADWLYATTGIKAPPIPGLEVAYEAGPAGVVNPRQLAAAQRRLAELAGAHVVMAAADRVEVASTEVSIGGAFGEVRAERALLATGAWAGELVGADLVVQRCLRTALRVDLGPAPEMPSLIIAPIERPDVHNLYWNPPVRYPDDRVLFKVGCEIVDPPVAESVADLERWFAGSGHPGERDALLDMTRLLLPGAELRSWDTVPCVVTRTPSGYPYVGWIDDRLAVALAGNGSSAKSSDEIGRLASTLFQPGGWSDDVIDQALFSPTLA